MTNLQTSIISDVLPLIMLTLEDIVNFCPQMQVRNMSKGLTTVNSVDLVLEVD